MGSVSAPDGQENPNQGTRTPPNLKLTGCPVVEAMTAWSLSPPLDSLSSVNKKALFDNPTRAFFKFLEGCLLRIAFQEIVEGSAHACLAVVGRRVVAARLGRAR